MDIKDKKILYELSKNSRLSFLQIARKVKLSKDAVKYRINNLEKKGILQKYSTIVNLSKLNYRTHILFFEFKRFDLNSEKESLTFLKNFPYSIWVSSPSGKWDIIADIISKDNDQFEANLSLILSNFKDKLKSYEVLETTEEFFYNHNYLLGKKEINLNRNKKDYNPDKIDYRILFHLSQNARLKCTDLSKKLNVSHDQISYRIKKLKRTGIIVQFTIALDLSKIGFAYYYLFLQLTALIKEKEKRIINYLKSRSEVMFMAKNIGKFNFNVDVIVKNPLELKQFLVDFRENFSDILESRETILMFDEIKNDYFPKGIYDDLIKNSLP